jgi:SAM-dependent MidA family methyltransferase
MERLDHFMARASAAYYANRDPYRDFTTSPEISQVFGEILGLWAAVVWEQIGRPDPVLLVETGPGRGTLMVDALRSIASVAPTGGAALRLHLVEASPRLRVVQAERLPGATWHDGLDTLPDLPMVLLANEFLDALPIRQFVWRGGQWLERFVAERLLNAQAPLPQPPFAGEGIQCSLSRGRAGEEDEQSLNATNPRSRLRNSSAVVSPSAPAPRSSSTTVPSTALPATASRRCAMAGRLIHSRIPALPT